MQEEDSSLIDIPLKYFLSIPEQKVMYKNIRLLTNRYIWFSLIIYHEHALAASGGFK